jgi:hypothetical protein
VARSHGERHDGSGIRNLTDRQPGVDHRHASLGLWQAFVEF